MTSARNGKTGTLSLIILLKRKSADRRKRSDIPAKLKRKLGGREGSSIFKSNLQKKKSKRTRG